MSAVPIELPRVLVVDDSAVIRQAIHKMLRSDFELVLASDGEAGWEKLSQDQRIAVLITDIEMPRLDGYAFICRVRAADDPRIRDMPIITITGAEDDETKARAYACGATDFITKPLNAGQLQARVQAYVSDREPLVPAGSEKDVDELTRLYSRSAFVAQGEKLFVAKEPGMAMIQIAVDGFRKLYRQHGDDVANRLLAWAAQQLLPFGEGNALVARVGGAEFAVLLPGADAARAGDVADRIRQRFQSARFTDGATVITLSVSVGVAAVSPQVNSFERLLQLSEKRVRFAESKGGDQVALSGLEDLLPRPEELVLAAAPAAAPDTTGAPALIPTDELQALAMNSPAHGEVHGTGPIADDLLSLDRALTLLGHGREERLIPYARSLVIRVLPLLRFYWKHEEFDMDDLKALEARLRRDE